jgi:hypothetical protein
MIRMKVTPDEPRAKNKVTSAQIVKQTAEYLAKGKDIDYIESNFEPRLKADLRYMDR